MPTIKPEIDFLGYTNTVSGNVVGGTASSLTGSPVASATITGIADEQSVPVIDGAFQFDPISFNLNNILVEVVVINNPGLPSESRSEPKQVFIP